MKNLRNILVTAFAVALILVIHSCTSSDDYLKFVDGGAISYTGKIDSLKFFPGRDRLKIKGLIISDPKVSQLRVYWNTKKDSVVIPINRTSGIDEVSSIIENLPENIYNFEVKTFDAKGNSSISQYITAQTYGTRYQASLTDRKIVSSKLSSDFSLTIDFATMDLTTGAYATEVVYTDNSNVQHAVTVPVTQNQLVVSNYKIGSKFKQRSLFLPVKTAIDIFYTDFVSKEPQVIDLTYMIKNNKRPFLTSSTDGGRWGTLADWTTNAACKNHGGYGGWDGGCCGNPPGTINLESGWGAPVITNGKIYQTITLEAGTYIFNAPLLASGSGLNSGYTLSDYVYLAVAKGSILPDSSGGVLETDPATLGFKRIVNTMNSESAIITFTITQSTQITLGISTTQGNERYGHFLSFSLFKKNN
ncbi:DUF5013 domain-containing protein [Flavobacterium sufflavum]|uniref:DUF5013 domain-containing protein n=1 Tax=Flavobacterium sufflavum TaxID=1921138 RepID=A0A3S2XM12_9FLAO|nr:DUF4998 domain-containing protein [Flavobacterium sufflavum]RVT79756.1 DUF5013 domain-containing protein [Flavobacterium sufflavum]